MASPSGPTSIPESEQILASAATVIITYTSLCLTGTAALCFFLLLHRRRMRNRSAVSDDAGNGIFPDVHRLGVDVDKLPAFAYTSSAGHGSDGPQCSVCLGMVQQAGEMVRLLPLCKHLYHVECIDMSLASNSTCPLCRSEIEPPGDGQPARTTELPM